MSDPLKILIAPDSFKECLTAPEVAEAIHRGVAKALPNAEITMLPVADGGDGFVVAMTANGKGNVLVDKVTGPLGDPVEAKWGLMQGGKTAIIEMAQAAGLMLVPPAKRDPTRTTTFGVGELIRIALRRGVDRILVGIGGSATNDGGIGMAQALGWGLFDSTGAAMPSPATGMDMERVAQLLPPHIVMDEHTIMVACDVDNPLLGPTGAAHTFAAQKGATAEQITWLEGGMTHLADVVGKTLGRDIRNTPGAGAAGGLGAGLMAFANADLVSGASLVLATLGLDELVQGSALVITGEGSINFQTMRGKAPWVIYERAKRHSVPTLMIGGDISQVPLKMKNARNLHIRGLTPPGMPASESIAHASELLESTARDFVQSFLD